MAKKYPKTLIDLRMEYHRETGIGVPLTNEFCNDMHYVCWLEDYLVRTLELKRQFIPWEPITIKH